MSYALLEELLEALDITDIDDERNMQRALDAASGWIERHCGRVFSVDVADVTREYYPTRVDELEVTDLNSITSLATDTDGDLTYATVWTATDYELLPLDGPPYQVIRAMPTSSQAFMIGERVEVVGKFGYAPTVFEMASLKQANILLATRWYKRHEAPFGILGATDIGQFERISKEDPDVIALLSPLVWPGGTGGSVSQWAIV